MPHHYLPSYHHLQKQSLQGVDSLREGDKLFFDIVRDNVDDKDDNDKDNNDEEEDKEEWREDGNKDSMKVEGNNDDEDSVVGYANYLISK